jgi:LysM repeat protein
MKMKMPKLLSRKKLRATAAARRPLRAAAEMDYDMSEPNMKLSRALLIVLVLHVVAVSGIIAFNAIKTRQASFLARASTSKTVAEVKPVAKPDKVASEDKAPVPHSPAKPIDKEKPKVDRPQPIEHASAPADSGKVHIVVKGDNPVTIAKKFKVAYDDLMEINHIQDPRKLQIGTRLLIPKPAKGRKTDE